MKNLPKIFLLLSVVSFALGASELADNRLVYIGRPVGAILFVLFMIFQFLKNETALYDQEQEQKIRALTRATRPSSPATPARGQLPSGLRTAA
jgi:hypothetical protein